jgi:hypothetical protein
LEDRHRLYYSGNVSGGVRGLREAFDALLDAGASATTGTKTGIGRETGAGSGELQIKSNAVVGAEWTRSEAEAIQLPAVPGVAAHGPRI